MTYSYLTNKELIMIKTYFHQKVYILTTVKKHNLMLRNILYYILFLRSIGRNQLKYLYPVFFARFLLLYLLKL
ncbi:hypothetical protein SAMN04488700_2109 [Carnobacterium iners]|uniref:Uncharacterized protein n=1 Tax=Carnobacterium iners TaxID=1073423 RepID=A0A1X7NL61_9LACT|nr:hypothetical protein SAMN04488700_2109 [Carnobacterium iners]